MIKKMTEVEFLNLQESYGGVCIACGELRWEGCEPDARNYECYECGAHKVMGAEEAMLTGHIEIVDN